MPVSVIIAAYNESHNIKDVVLRAKKQNVDSIIVVDDGSSDDTSDKALSVGAVVLRHIVNLGKGAALKTGADYALLMGADKLVFIDGDGQHEPEDIPRVLSALEKSDIVFTVRRRAGKMPFMLRFGNWFLTSYIGLLFGITIHDSQCGFRAMTADAYRKVRWSSVDYSVESEMLALAGIKNLRYEEVTIKTIYHDKYKGTTPIDGLPIAWNLLLWRLRRWR